MTRPARTALALIAVLALTSCGKSDTTPPDASTSSSPTSSPASGSAAVPSVTPTADPATGTEVKGTGYTYRLPQGWEDISADLKAAQPGIDSGARATPATPPFTANLNVLTTESVIKGKPTEAQITALAKALKAQVAEVSPDMATKATTVIDGATTVHQEGKAASGTSKYYLVQYLSVSGGNNYSLTFAFSRKTTAEQREKITDPILASFSFT